MLYPASYGALTQLWAGTSPETIEHNGKVCNATKILFWPFCSDIQNRLPCSFWSHGLGSDGAEKKHTILSLETACGTTWWSKSRINRFFFCFTIAANALNWGSDSFCDFLLSWCSLVWYDLWGKGESSSLLFGVRALHGNSPSHHCRQWILLVHSPDRLGDMVWIDSKLTHCASVGCYESVLLRFDYRTFRNLIFWRL